MIDEGVEEVGNTILNLGLIGYPLSHSLSPVIHQTAMKWLGVEGTYRLYPVLPLPEGKPAVEGLIEQLRRDQIHGLNVTIPHKQSLLPYMDGLTDSARAIGAVNTIYKRNGQVVGDNTDANGFWSDLLPRLGKSTDYQNALVLGAGGSARAVVYALERQGWHITVTSRRTEQAEQLASHPFRSDEPNFPGTPRIQILPFTPDDLKYFLGQLIAAQSPGLLIVNTTPMGMYPDIETNPWNAGLPFPKNAFIYDLVYHPAETALVRSAREQGLPACNGLGMLVEQAALSFERWTGLPAPREAMRAAATNS